LVHTRKRVCQGTTGRSSAVRLSRKREHACKCVGRSEARGGLRSTCKLPSQEGLPGADVLAVVLAHRGTYAEVRGRCWLQISSRNALQKQRQTRVNGSLGGTLFRVYSVLVSSKSHRDSMQWRPKATTRRQGPGWRHERHSAVRSLERGSGRVPRSVSVRKIWHVRDGSIGRVLTNGSCSGLRKTALFTDGTEQVASVDTQAIASSGHVQPCAGRERGPRVSTTGATEVTFSQLPKKLQNAPKRVWRRETLISSRVESLRAQTR